MFTPLFFVLLILAPFAHASEGMFGYAYTIDNTPQGQWEYEQKHTLRAGKAAGRFRAIDLRQEFEYGITNDLQVAFYLDSMYMFQQNVPDVENPGEYYENFNAFNMRGTAVEFLYRYKSPYRDWIGIGFYTEAEFNDWHHAHGTESIERAIENRLIVQKNFLDDTLTTSLNLLVEPEWKKERGEYSKELYAEISWGIAYRFRPKWFTGLELRNHMEFPNMNLGHQEHSAYFAGANIHYGSQRYWVTLSILPQVYGWPRNLGANPAGGDIHDRNLHLGEHERLEVRFMFGVPLNNEG